MQNSQTILEYSAPQIFFGGEYRWRTHDVALTAAVLLVVGSLFAVLGLLSPNGSDSLGIGFLAAGTVPLGIAVYLLKRWTRNERIAVRITADGIDVGKRHWSWSRISELGAYRQDYYVYIYFDYIKRRGYMARSNRPVTTCRRESISLTPNIRKEYYHTFLREIEPYLAENFPHVKLIFELQKPPETLGS